MAGPGALLLLGGLLGGLPQIRGVPGGSETPQELEEEVSIVQRSDPQPPHCFTRTLHELSCFWDSDGEPDPHRFILQYRLEQDPWQECPLGATALSPIRGSRSRSRSRSRFWCSLPAAATVTFVPLELRVLQTPPKTTQGPPERPPETPEGPPKTTEGPPTTSETTESTGTPEGPPKTTEGPPEIIGTTEGPPKTTEGPPKTSETTGTPEGPPKTTERPPESIGTTERPPKTSETTGTPEGPPKTSRTPEGPPKTTKGPPEITRTPPGSTKDSETTEIPPKSSESPPGTTGTPPKIFGTPPGTPLFQRTIFIDQVVLPGPPRNVSVSVSAGGARGELCVRWAPPPGPYLHSSLVFELALSAPGAAPRTVGVPAGRREQRVGGLSPRTPYSVRARARPDGLSYGGFWSPWSAPASASTGPELDAVTLGLSCLLVLLVLGLGALGLLGHRRTLRAKLWPPVPGPEREFEGLFSNYGGNFQLWLCQGPGSPCAPPAAPCPPPELEHAVEEVGGGGGGASEAPPPSPAPPPPQGPGPSPSPSFEYTLLFEPGSALLCPSPRPPGPAPYANLAPPTKGAEPKWAGHAPHYVICS